MGRRGPPPPRTLLPVRSSYGLMRQTLLALPSFGYSPRSESLCRLLPAPAASGFFPTLFCKSFPRCLVPYPDGPTECSYLFLPRCHRPSPRHYDPSGTITYRLVCLAPGSGATAHHRVRGLVECCWLASG